MRLRYHHYLCSITHFVYEPAVLTMVTFIPSDGWVKLETACSLLILEEHDFLPCPYPDIWSHDKKVIGTSFKRKADFLLHCSFGHGLVGLHQTVAAMLLSRRVWPLNHLSRSLSPSSKLPAGAYDLRTIGSRQFHHVTPSRSTALDVSTPAAEKPTSSGIKSHSKHAHAVLSTFDLFSIGVGPSSSHTGALCFLPPLSRTLPRDL